MPSILMEAMGDIWRYIQQMFPCAFFALLLFFCLSPVRKRRLAAQHLKSSPRREGMLLFFVLFCSGLAALTLFPANLWTFVIFPEHYPPETELLDFYPTGAEVWARLTTLPEELPRLLTPFPNGVGWNFRNYWSAFLFLGNIGMFLPIGFFVALLWRGPTWWKSTLLGGGASCFIESVQLFIGRGTDLDDLILNTLGALCGYGLFCLLHRSRPQLCAQFHCKPKEEP